MRAVIGIAVLAVVALAMTTVAGDTAIGKRGGGLFTTVSAGMTSYIGDEAEGSYVLNPPNVRHWKYEIDMQFAASVGIALSPRIDISGMFIMSNQDYASEGGGAPDATESQIISSLAFTARYLPPVSDRFSPYIRAGLWLPFSEWSYEKFGDGMGLGIIVGVGLKYKVADFFAIAVEADDMMALDEDRPSRYSLSVVPEFTIVTW